MLHLVGNVLSQPQKENTIAKQALIRLQYIPEGDHLNVWKFMADGNL